MKKALRFWIAMFIALGAMISLAPRDNKLRESASDEHFGIAQHFEKAWAFIGEAVNNHA
jgi:hypothetical protein